MKIVYSTNQDKSIYLNLNNTAHTLYPGEILDTGDDEQSNIMQICTQKIAKLNVWSTIKLLIGRIILNVANIFIMNFPGEWFDDLDPFILSTTYKVECQTIILRYIPAQISQSPIFVRKPQLIINDKLVDAKIEPDINSVKVSFFKYIFDFVSLWIYCTLLTTLIFVYSGKFLSLIVVFILILFGITFPLIFKIIRTYNKKQRFLNFFAGSEK